MQASQHASAFDADITIGRIVSVTGAKAIVLLDGRVDASGRKTMHRP